MAKTLSLTKDSRAVLRSLWHPSTESPGRKSVYILFKVKGHSRFLCHLTRFRNDGVVPAEAEFKMDDGTQKLAVAWAYADELTSTITEKMIAQAKDGAWAWYDKD